MRTYRFLRRCCAALSLVTMSACGGSQDIPNNLVGDKDAASDYQQALFDALPEKEKQTLTAKLAALEQGLSADFEKAKLAPKSSQALARFADNLIGKLRYINDSLPRLEELLNSAQAESEAQGGKGFSDFNLRSAQAKMVTALRERAADQSYLDAAVNADPAVGEAHRRWTADSSQNKPSLARIVEGLANEPCAFASGGKPGEGRFVVDGVALGMDRASAIRALCAAKNNDVILAGEAEKRSHIGEYQDFGFTRNSQIAELPWTMARPFQLMDGGQARTELAKLYQSSVQYCFGCKPQEHGARPDGYAKMRNNIAFRFLPNGKIAGISRTQFFGRTVNKDVGSGFTQSVWEPTPQSLKSLLAPLQQQLGSPSFVMSSGERPVYAWAFPDGKSALPQEKWFLTHATGFDLVHLNKPGLIFDGQIFSRKKLIAARPSAGYCMNRHTDAFGFLRHLVAKYFTYDDAWAISEAYIAARRTGATVPANASVAYSTRYEAPGFIDRCGIIVLATFAKDDNTDDNRGSYDGVVKPLSPDAPIYRLTLQMIDTNVARAQFVAEENAVRARTPVSDARVVMTGSAAGASDTARQLAGEIASRDYIAWKTCLYKRLGNNYEEVDKVKCQGLDPQGTVARR